MPLTALYCDGNRIDEPRAAAGACRSARCTAAATGSRASSPLRGHAADHPALRRQPRSRSLEPAARHAAEHVQLPLQPDQEPRARCKGMPLGALMCGGNQLASIEPFIKNPPRELPVRLRHDPDGGAGVDPARRGRATSASPRTRATSRSCWPCGKGDVAEAAGAWRPSSAATATSSSPSSCVGRGQGASARTAGRAPGDDHEPRGERLRRLAVPARAAGSGSGCRPTEQGQRMGHRRAVRRSATFIDVLRERHAAGRRCSSAARGPTTSTPTRRTRS